MFVKRNVMKKKNLVREIRKAAEMSQEKFAPLLGRSMPMLRLYETGHVVPPDVADRLKSIAAKYDRADLAMALVEGDWEVKRVFYPGETIITTARAKAGNAKWHDLVDEVFGSGQADTIRALEVNLAMCAEMVRARRSGAKKSGEKTRHG